MDYKQSLIKKLKDYNLTISVAESCTGGQLSSFFVAQEGASSFFSGGVIAYSPKSKVDLLKIDSKKIDDYGVVSKEIANEMSVSVKNLFNTNISISTTGNAGPSSVNSNEPVGKIFIAINYMGKVEVEECDFKGDRNGNIILAVDKALFLLNNIL